MMERIKPFQISINTTAFLIAVMFSIPLLFSNAFQHDFPMGYAGLFTQMARQIADEDFVLPDMSPYYGPGGIPFAYPPFGLYLLAVFIKLTGKYYIFLRYLPPILSLISIGLTFILAQKFFKQPFMAMFVAILSATSVDLYTAHTWSSGVVRAPAFIFTILCMYFYSTDPNERSTRNILFSGLFFGLAALSHLAYALFCLFWILIASISPRNWKKSISDPFFVGLVALLVSSIWIVPVVSRYGWDVFFGAFNSHGGSELLLESISLPSLVRLFQFNLSPVLSSPLLMISLLVGVVYMFLHKQYRFVVFFLLITLFFPENARFVYWLACFMAGYGFWFISLQIYELVHTRMNISQPIGIAFISIPLLAILWWNGFTSISRFTPFLTTSALELAENSSDIFSGEGSYLALLIQDEAEWMPFLLERKPLVSQWGSEWLGEYDQQTRLMSLFQGCRKEKDWQCVRSVLNNMESSPDFIISYRIDKKMNEQIIEDGHWKEIFSNERYIVWRVVEPQQ